MPWDYSYGELEYFIDGNKIKPNEETYTERIAFNAFNPSEEMTHYHFVCDNCAKIYAPEVPIRTTNEKRPALASRLKHTSKIIKSYFDGEKKRLAN